MMSAKMATPGLLKITVFWNKGYYLIIFVEDVTSKEKPLFLRGGLGPSSTFWDWH